MKKKIWGCIIAAVLIVIVVFVIANFNTWFYQASGQQKRFMTEINAYNTKVYYYGNMDPGKEITLDYEKVSEFTDKTIGDSDGEYVYHMIVIFDFDGKMDISNEELLLIKDYCENKHYDMFYYGQAHMDQFKECDFFENIGSEEYGFVYNGSYWMKREGKEEYLNSYLLTGNWSSDDNKYFDYKDKHMVWKRVINYMRVVIDESNKDL